MHILALDLAGQTGWARWRPGMDAPSYGIARLPKGSPGQTFAAFRDFLTGKIVGENIEHIVIESIYVAEGMVTALPRLYGLLGVAQEVAYRRGLSVNTVLVGEWRNHFIRQRTAPKTVAPKNRRDWLKNQTKLECERRGWTVRTTDEADALGLIAYERARLFPAFGCEGELFGYAMMAAPLGMEKAP